MIADVVKKMLGLRLPKKWVQNIGKLQNIGTRNSLKSSPEGAKRAPECSKKIDSWNVEFLQNVFQHDSKLASKIEAK